MWWNKRALVLFAVFQVALQRLYTAFVSLYVAVVTCCHVNLVFSVSSFAGWSGGRSDISGYALVVLLFKFALAGYVGPQVNN